MNLSLAEREEIFFILSSKLEKEDAEFLEKKISIHILERENNNMKNLIKEIDNLQNIKDYLGGRDNHKGAKDLWDISWEGYRNGLNLFKKYFNNKIDSNRDNLIEILK